MNEWMSIKKKECSPVSKQVIERVVEKDKENKNANPAPIYI